MINNAGHSQDKGPIAYHDTYAAVLTNGIPPTHIAFYYDNHLDTTTHIIIARFLISEASERKHFEKGFVNLEILRGLLSPCLYLRSMFAWPDA